MGWLWLAGIAAAAVAVDRVALWAEARGWIYWRHRKPDSNAGGVFSDLVELFEPSHRHLVEEQQWERYRTAQPESGAPPSRNLTIDLDAGTATVDPDPAARGDNPAGR